MCADLLVQPVSCRLGVTVLVGKDPTCGGCSGASLIVCGHCDSGEEPGVLVSVQQLHLKSPPVKVSGVLSQRG